MPGLRCQVETLQERPLGVRGLDDRRCFLSSALLLHRLCVLATRAVEDVNLGHVFEVELMYQTHRAVAVRAFQSGCGCGHGKWLAAQGQVGELGGAR